MSKEIKNINGYPHVRYHNQPLTEEQIINASREFYEKIDSRRSIRYFSDKPVSREVIENLIKAASSAPSGAHKQPWTFCVVQDPEIKSAIREAAEKEEYESYNNRMSTKWLEDLKPLATDWKKPFLETAPYLIIVFKHAYELDEEGNKHTNYYVNESVGLACGFLITAIHFAGLATLTHTPSPMNFLSKILKRPANERPYLLLPVGYPAGETYVPDIHRKPLEEVAVFMD